MCERSDCKQWWLCAHHVPSARCASETRAARLEGGGDGGKGGGIVLWFVCSSVVSAVTAALRVIGRHEIS